MAHGISHSWNIDSESLMRKEIPMIVEHLTSDFPPTILPLPL